MKKSIISILIVFIMMLISLTNLSLKHFIDRNQYINSVSRGYFNDNAVNFIIEDNYIQARKVMDVLYHSRFNNFALVSNNYHGDNLTYIYIKGEYESFPIVEGRYFNEEDFFNNNNYIVIGQNLKNKVVQRNNKEIYSINGIDFEVIGILGFDQETKLDDAIIVNMDSQLAISNNYNFIIDSRMNDIKNDNMGIFNFLLNQRVFNAKTLDVDPISTNRLLGYNRNTLFIHILIYICFLIAMLNILNFWIIGKQKKIAVMKLVGIRENKLKFSLFKSFCIHAFIGIIIGVLLSVIIFGKVDGRVVMKNIVLLNMLTLVFSFTMISNCVNNIKIVDKLK